MGKESGIKDENNMEDKSQCVGEQEEKQKESESNMLSKSNCKVENKAGQKKAKQWYIKKRRKGSCMGKKKSVIERQRKQNDMCTEKIIEFGNKTRWEKQL